MLAGAEARAPVTSGAAFGWAATGRLWLGLLRNWSFWRSRGRRGLTVVRPRKIIGTAGRGGYCLALRQNFRGKGRVSDAGSSPERQEADWDEECRSRHSTARRASYAKP
jgi:hypothetical protein